MRILTNFTKKVATAQYENETFTVTVECDLDMGVDSVGERADALFAEARAAVQRQIAGTASKEAPATTIPAAAQDAQQTAPQATTATGAVTGNVRPMRRRRTTKPDIFSTKNKGADVQQPQTQQSNGADAANQPLTMTDKQKSMIEGLAGDVFKTKEDAVAWLRKEFDISDPIRIPRATASRIIEKLLALKRSAA